MSHLEDTLLKQIELVRLPKPEREFKFHPSRRWRFDFAWPEQRVAVEVEGGVWSKGRHTRGSGFIEDCAKYNEAAIHGWVVIRVCEDHIDSGDALTWIEQILSPVHE